MPTGPAPFRVHVVIRPPGRAPFRAVALDDLTDVVRIYRKQMAISRDELKQKRLKAMGVVGTEMQATADMYDRVVVAAGTVQAARTQAEAAHMADLSAQVADLKEMADELQEFGQAVPLPVTAVSTVKLATVSNAASALAALNAAQPQPNGWDKGDAYVETHPAKS